MLESQFKKEFIDVLKLRSGGRFPLDFVDTKPNNRSMPDLILLGPNGKWAALEFKRSIDASHRPNQDFHVNRLNDKGFARFVYPETAEEVLRELEALFTDS